MGLQSCYVFYHLFGYDHGGVLLIKRGRRRKKNQVAWEDRKFWKRWIDRSRTCMFWGEASNWGHYDKTLIFVFSGCPLMPVKWYCFFVGSSIDLQGSYTLIHMCVCVFPYMMMMLSRHIYMARTNICHRIDPSWNKLFES